MPAIACIPPTLKILLIPQSFAVYKISAGRLPFLFGGEHIIISLHPAILAGIANIKIDENKGAEPPGIYNPTLSIPYFFCQHTTPLVVSTLIVFVF